MSYTVFTDFHHASLLQSLILLFEKRLGGKVFRPIGMEWHEKGFWKVYDHPATAAQFLGLGGATPVMPEDGSPPLNEFVTHEFDYKTQSVVYNCKDIDSGQTNKAITFDGFMKMKIDIIIASMPQHVEPFKKLAAIHPSRPKLIFQIGNQWDGAHGALNIMASAKMPPIAGTNFIEYHQEFDLGVFHPPAANIMPGPIVKSFVNVFDNQEHFQEDWRLFEAMGLVLSFSVNQTKEIWQFKSHGGQCRDGAIGPASKLAESMREARFIWHTKAGGDGFGHIIHNAAAVGRPLIVKKEYYRGKMAEELLIDEVTCIAIDGLTPEQICRKIAEYSKPDKYVQMSAAAYNQFRSVVNFDREFIHLQKFLANLV